MRKRALFLYYNTILGKKQTKKTAAEVKHDLNTLPYEVAPLQAKKGKKKEAPLVGKPHVGNRPVCL